ncbi:DUF6640 family protein [Streptomyces endophyticus]|uniref:Acetyltransferase n=1 Tax=Streptomyces endophyticus TaxID=714166 RepID=A0ABU6EYL7_9ACTN|nr:DUF6640 family protein [Streptomyces endophyticus]MEB8336849.1 acetyltransferase [Streptomyces endophyticus]
MPSLTPGRALLTLTSLSTMCGAYIADWNDTHIHNPNWPPHAKFHNAQTMSTGAALGAIGLWAVWNRGAGTADQRLKLATGAASLYWITQLSAIAYPGTAFMDPPKKGAPQAVVAGASLALNGLAYALERRRLRG